VCIRIRGQGRGCGHGFVVFGIALFGLVPFFLLNHLLWGAVGNFIPFVSVGLGSGEGFFERLAFWRVGRAASCLLIQSFMS